MTWVKLCSIKSEQDIQAVRDAQPDAVGFLVGQAHISNDFITPQKARKLTKLLPQDITPILVTHFSGAEEIYNLARETGIYTIQLHGDSSVDQIVELRKLLPDTAKLIYAAHVIGRSVSIDIKSFEPHIDMLLLDSCDPEAGKVGGTGQTHDWSVSAEIVRTTSIPVILAGGLNPDNVAEAIKQVKPYGVDVNSGVKNSAGFRSNELCRIFVLSAKS